ncbi:MAG: hypothetical protein J0L69_15385 [Bacteroidetes bacterium]|nr:hypothetical protein [Bacteroidota bacterium]
MALRFEEVKQYKFEIFDQLYKNGSEKVGEVELWKDDKYWINKIEVSPDLRGLKDRHYGTEIIQYLLEHYKPLRISLSSKPAHYTTIRDNGDTRCLTWDGFGFFKACFKNGILHKNNFEFPFEDILMEYKTDRFLDNSFYKLQNMVNTLSQFARSYSSNR